MIISVTHPYTDQIKKKNQIEALTSSSSKKSSEMGRNSSGRKGASSPWEIEILGGSPLGTLPGEREWELHPLVRLRFRGLPCELFGSFFPLGD